MLALLKLIAILAAGTSIGVSLFDGFLHTLLFARTKRVRKHLGLAMARLGFSVIMAILLWYVIIPAPVTAWATIQAWGFIGGMLTSSAGLLLASTVTYDEFAGA